MPDLRNVVALVVLAALAAGCGGDEPARPGADRKAPPRPAAISGSGTLVDIGGGRSLALSCAGSGTPTVVLEAGFGGSSDNWSAVHPELARVTRTCAYDRAGLGSSLPIAGVRDAGDEIRDLERLLERARVPPPYVLVGHSYGGLLARLFADAHRRESAGVVLVDAVGRNQDRRLMAIRRAAPPRLRRTLPKLRPIEAGVDLRASERLGARVTTLGDTPLAVVTRGRPDADIARLPRRVARAVERLWHTMQGELAALSGNGLHVVAARSDHFVQSFAGGQPDVVTGAVRAVVEAARTGTPLTPCERVFQGAAVRCRP